MSFLTALSWVSSTTSENPCDHTEVEGNLSRGIVNWLSEWYKAQNSPIDNFSNNFSSFPPETKKWFLQTMLAIYGFYSEKVGKKNI